MLLRSVAVTSQIRSVISSRAPYLVILLFQQPHLSWDDSERDFSIIPMLSNFYYPLAVKLLSIIPGCIVLRDLSYFIDPKIYLFLVFIISFQDLTCLHLKITNG